LIKVLHIIHSLTVGGAARTMIATARHSARLGPYEHHLCMLNLTATDPAAVELAMRNGMKIPAVRNREELLREISSADIVQVNWWQHPEMDQFLRSDLPQMRILGWLHCAGDKPPMMVTRSMVSFFTMAVGGSSYTYLCPAIQGLPEEERLAKTDFVVGGADFDRLKDFTKLPHTGFNVGYIGTVNFVKMHRHYVRMHAGLKIPDYKVIVCGGNMQSTLQSQAQSLGEAQHFDIRGYEPEIQKVLQILDVYGYPLCEDTYAASELNLQEAMFAGIPPVVFPHGGIQTLVVDGFTGLVVRSEREYREALEYLHIHPLERDRMGANAREFAEQMFGAEIHAAKMNSLYTKLLEQPKAKRVYPGDERTGAELFLASLDWSCPHFELSCGASNIDTILEAENDILKSSPLMRQGGIQPYAGHYSKDALLHLWSGIALFGDGQSAEAAEYILKAYQLEIHRFAWRAFYYLALCAIDCRDYSLARSCIENMLIDAPDFEQAKLLQKLLSAGEPKLRKRDLIAPEFE
jgi:glycosyltransferase involved in cell wall biosynthesis